MVFLLGLAEWEGQSLHRKLCTGVFPSSSLVRGSLRKSFAVNAYENIIRTKPQFLFCFRYYLVIISYVFAVAVYTNSYNFEYVGVVMGGHTVGSWLCICAPHVAVALGLFESFHQFFVAVITFVAYFFMLMVGALIREQLVCIYRGQTQYEKKKGVTKYNQGWRKNLRELLGDRWVLVFFWPWTKSAPGSGIEHVKVEWILMCRQVILNRYLPELPFANKRTRVAPSDVYFMFQTNRNKATVLTPLWREYGRNAAPKMRQCLQDVLVQKQNKDSSENSIQDNVFHGTAKRVKRNMATRAHPNKNLCHNMKYVILVCHDFDVVTKAFVHPNSYRFSYPTASVRLSQHIPHGTHAFKHVGNKHYCVSKLPPVSQTFLSGTWNIARSTAYIDKHNPQTLTDVPNASGVKRPKSNGMFTKFWDLGHSVTLLFLQSICGHEQGCTLLPFSTQSHSTDGTNTASTWSADHDKHQNDMTRTKLPHTQLSSFDDAIRSYSEDFVVKGNCKICTKLISALYHKLVTNSKPWKFWRIKKHRNLPQIFWAKSDKFINMVYISQCTALN